MVDHIPMVDSNPEPIMNFTQHYFTDSAQVNRAMSSCH